MNRLARRSARSLAVALAIPYALFALDTAVLSVSFFVHLIPAGLVLWLTAIAWNRPDFGTFGFGVAGALSVLFFRTWAAPERFLLLTLPLLLVAGLFRLARSPAIRPDPGPPPGPGSS